MNTVTLTPPLARWVTAAAAVASRDTGRSVLTGVHVTTGTAILSPILGAFDGIRLAATDSYRLVVVDIPATRYDTADEHNGTVAAAYSGTGSVLIPATVGKLPARSPLTLSWNDPDPDTDGDPKPGPDRPVTVSTFAKGAVTVTTVHEPAPAAAFPRIAALFPDTVGSTEPDTYNPELLGSMLVAFSKAAGDNDVVRFVGSVIGKPARVDIVGDGYAAASIIMPVRTRDGGPLAHIVTDTDGTAAVAS